MDQSPFGTCPQASKWGSTDTEVFFVRDDTFVEMEGSKTAARFPGGVQQFPFQSPKTTLARLPFDGVLSSKLLGG